MDTSQTYIKMRLAATPDMGRGDTTLTGHITQMFGNDAVMDEYGNYYAGYRSMCFKLERQDQLQEMSVYSWGEQFNHVSQFIDKHLFPIIYKSWEQLWLAFVMKEKYNKTWDGEKWGG